ncbi:ATP-binding protein [Agathobacter rectalis]|nr:ATP-binding protein [Agathobacter rectalis]
MRNRLTFANVIGVLLENKKKTYPQHQLVRSLFSAYLDDTLTASELIADDTTMYSRWCNGARPIPIDILKTYEDEDEWDTMEDDFRDKIIPNLLNEAQARIQMEELITDSIKTIGQEMADALIQEPDNAAFFCSVVRYAILNDHSTGALYSPDLSEVILCNKLPSCNQAFIGRKDEIKAIASHLSNQSVLFITGMAGIGKSEVAKAYAQTNRKKYTNIIYLYYTGDLRKDIANLTFADDSVEMNEEVRFQNHYKVMQRLHTDTLLILDNFNVLPKDEPFLKELMKNDMQLLITSRCKLKNYDSIEIKELDKEKELTELFYKHCPSAKRDPDSVSAIIEEVNCHTLTVCMAALTLEASGMEPEELLQELRSCGIGQNMEEIEVFKDDEFSYASMIGHLRMLMKLNRLNEDSIDILRNLSLLPVSGVYKSAFKMWLELDSLKNVNELIRYGIISEDTDKNEDIYVSNSRLLSKDEVENIGIDNFSNINTMSTSRAAKRTYGKLTLTFSGSQSISGKSVSCKLNGNANWDFGAFTSSEKNPAIGKDFMGITWSGLFTTNSSSCSATDLTGKVTYPTMVDSIANGGRVWSFEESLFEDHFANYNKNINATINIKKNTMTGNGNTAEAVLKYIHTYQKTTGSVSMNVGSDSVSAGFTLSNVKNQWSLVCNITGIYY